MILSYDAVAQRFADDCENAVTINRQNLQKLLNDNAKTIYGKRYGFASITSVDDYEKQVPLSTYEDYADIICRPNGSTVYPIYAIPSSSGTTGIEKTLPLTEEALSRYSTYYIDLARHEMQNGGKVIQTNTFPKPKGKAAILSNVHMNYLHDREMFDFSAFVGGTDCYYADDIKEVMYLKARLALCTPDLSAFISMFLYDLALLFSYIEKNWKRLLNDIRTDTFSADLPERIQKIALSLRPSEEWLNQAESILTEGFDTPFVPRLWKDLRYVIGIGGKLFWIQEKALVKYIGDLPVHFSIYASSECMMAVAPHMSKALGKAEYAFMPSCGYFEFIPRNGKTTVRMEDLKIGEEYEPVITTFSGLYRYQTGDIVRVCSFYGQSPVVEVIGRRQLVINIAGEKIDTYAATEAVNRFAKHQGLELSDFCMGINVESVPQSYCLFVESDTDVVLHEPESDFDACLRQAALHYDNVRILNLVSMPTVHVVPRGEIFNSINAGGKAGHKKPRVFIKEDARRYLLGKERHHESK